MSVDQDPLMAGIGCPGHCRWHVADMVDWVDRSEGTGWLVSLHEGVLVFILLTWMLSGDVAWEMTFVIVTIVYTGTRYLERKYTGR